MSRIRGLELQFNIEKSNLKSAADCIVLASHCLLINEGLQCTGTGDVWPETAEQTSELLPKDWNLHQDLYSLRYVSEDRLNRVLLKIVKADRILMINAVMNESIAATMSLPISNHVEDSYENYSSAYKDLASLTQSFRKEILEVLMEKSTESKPQQSAPEQASSTPSSYPSQPQGGSRLYVERESFPPSRPGFPRIGGSDLDPLGRAGGGGMLMDPTGFGIPGRPTLPDFGVGGPGGLPRGAVPPGARFDPFMPPINPRGFGPDRDHFRPPDGSDFI